MNNMIEIRDLNKGDLFLYNEIIFTVDRADNYFKASGESKDILQIQIVGIYYTKSDFKVQLISRANESTNI